MQEGKYEPFMKDGETKMRTVNLPMATWNICVGAYN